MNTWDNRAGLHGKKLKILQSWIYWRIISESSHNVNVSPMSPTAMINPSRTGRTVTSALLVVVNSCSPGENIITF